MTFRQLKLSFISELKENYPENELYSIFFILSGFVFKLSKSDINLSYNEEVPEGKLLQFNNCVEELRRSKPIQYITGTAAFYGLEFIVNENVLIPRQETEELVHLIIKDNVNFSKELKILDIGTGSGCIAVSLSANIPKSKVFACDISEKAIEVAKKNARLNNAKVQFSIFDITSDTEEPIKNQFDIIVSNPPYVISQQKTEMQNNVLYFEPHLALFAPDDNPLFFYNKILQFSEIHLISRGWIYFEINEIYQIKINELLLKFDYKNIEILKDLNNKFRIAKAQKNG
ncbi:MAG: protein-(glutamine-N5) methyltransferase, release factor-specific [Bacteroidetes bacterium GWA2_30_7]|nr:MAG: protein-(glutamine-N5) methyltransferase, release factor-specific [Bacteroidetes bacterium GWA2_30_7]